MCVFSSIANLLDFESAIAKIFALYVYSEFQSLRSELAGSTQAHRGMNSKVEGRQSAAQRVIHE